MSGLPWLDAAQGIGGLEAGDDSQIPGRYDGCEFVTFSHHTAHVDIGDFAKPTVDWGTDEPTVHFIFETLERSLGRRLAAA